MISDEPVHNEVVCRFEDGVEVVVWTTGDSRTSIQDRLSELNRIVKDRRSRNLSVAAFIDSRTTVAQ